MGKARGTYWYGIFQGTQQSSLFCPEFYLGEREKENYGDMAYITSTTFYYQGEARQAYIALYTSSSHLRNMLKDNLPIDGSVSYIINERNAVVASSDESLSGIYLLNYETIEDSFMSSNNFIERDILDTKVYAGFYNISNSQDWFMVTVLPVRSADRTRVMGSDASVLYLCISGFLDLCPCFWPILLARLDHQNRTFFRHPSNAAKYEKAPLSPMASPV